jgi:hypothetical protein
MFKITAFLENKQFYMYASFPIANINLLRAGVDDARVEHP